MDQPNPRKKDEVGLDYQGDGDQSDGHRVGKDGLSLKGEDYDQSQQQSGFGYPVELFAEYIFKPVHTMTFKQDVPGNKTGGPGGSQQTGPPT